MVRKRRRTGPTKAVARLAGHLVSDRATKIAAITGAAVPDVITEIWQDLEEGTLRFAGPGRNAWIEATGTNPIARRNARTAVRWLIEGRCANGAAILH